MRHATRVTLRHAWVASRLGASAGRSGPQAVTEKQRYVARLRVALTGAAVRALCWAAPAAATASSPTVVTGSGIPTSGTTAVLEGTVNQNGALVTECRFEYEPEAGLHQSAPCVQSVGEGSGSVTVSGTISGLTPARTYGFVLVASSGAGSMSGGLGTFTTPALPSVWTFGGYASSSTAMQQYTTAMLNGQAAGDGTAVTDCHFEYGGSPSLGASVPCAQPVGAGWTPVPVSAAITSLLWSSTYYDRLFAPHRGGTRHRTPHAFATPALPVVSSPVPYAPSAPTPNFWYSATENTISQNSTSTSPPHRTSAAAARCAKLHGRRRSHCYAALR